MASSMSPPIAGFLILALCLLSAMDMASSTKADFAYLKLAWPGGFCGLVSPCCTPTTGKPAADFLVVALETYSSATGNAVTNCSQNCKFYVNPIASVIGDMYLYWPSIICPSSNGKDKWTNNWCTYGYCFNLTGTELDYFSRTLALRQKVDVLVTLGKYGIVPSKSKTYKLKAIQEALLPTLGFSTVVDCFKKPKKYSWQQDIYYLSTIRICVSIDAKYIISCPIREKSSCGENVWFLPNPFAKVAGEEPVDAAVNPIKLPSEGEAVV